MLYKISTKDGDIELTPAQVLEMLMSKHMTVSRVDFEVMSYEFASFLQAKNAMQEASLLQLILIAFSLGYYYRVFKEKNEVEVIEDESNCYEDGCTSSCTDCMCSTSKRDINEGNIPDSRSSD